MSVDAARTAVAHVHGHDEENYLTCSKGWKSWAFTLDHKRIGVMYLVAILTSFLLGGVMAMLIRLELFTPGKLFLSEDAYNHMFTLHGAVMTFLFLIPSIPAALGNFIVPVMLGVKDVAFPRMNLGSFYLWVAGAIFFFLAIVLGGLDTGWTFYTPYSTTTSTSVITAVLGVFVLGFSSIFTGLNFLVTINMMRPAGMTWFKMPLFLWSIYATSIIQILATPVLGITGLLLIAERAFGIGIFDPARGGDPVLFQHFFWFYSHPAVYIMILPAMGIISELMSTFSRKPVFGYRFVAYSSIAIALLGFLVWGITCSSAGSRPWRRWCSRIDVFGVHSVGDQGLQLAGDDVQRVNQRRYADVLRPGISLSVWHWRTNGPVPRDVGHRRPLARHVLHRRPLPLCR